MFKMLLTAFINRTSKNRADRAVKNGKRSNRNGLRLQCQLLETRINPVLVTSDLDQIGSTTIVGTLRWAIEQINTTSTPNVITFDSAFGTTLNVIQLKSNLTLLQESTTITGFSDNSRVTINGTTANHFTALGGTSGVSLDISGITIINSSRGLLFDGGTHTVDNLNFEDSVGSNGAAIQATNSADLTITDSTFTNNAVSDDGGAIRLDGGGTLTISDSLFQGNTAGGSGGSIFINEGNLSMTDSLIANSTADENGGGIAVNEGEVSISGTSILPGTSDEYTFYDCEAGTSTSTGSGGGLFLYHGTLDINDIKASNCLAYGAGGTFNVARGQSTFTDAIIINSEAKGVGGGICTGINPPSVGIDFSTTFDHVLLDTCLATGASSGGGFYVQFGEFFMRGSSKVTNCSTTGTPQSASGGGGGGAIAAVDLYEIFDSEISGCTALTGGGLAISGSAGQIESSQFLNNLAKEGPGGTGYAQGGGILDTSPHMLLIDCTISGNTADIGGGILCGSAYSPGEIGLIAKGTTISNNTAIFTNGGGLCFLDGKLVIEEGTISDNSAMQDGGGVYAANDVSECEIASTTISGNEADRDGGGFWTNNAIVTVTNSTISTNTAGESGGGIYDETESAANMIVFRSTIDSNKANDGNGGGIFFDDGILVIKDSTISRNEASEDGGGMFVKALPDVPGISVILQNSTIAANEAGQLGGGVHFQEHRDILNILHCTIVENQSGDTTATFTGGGISLSANSTGDRIINLDATVLSGNVGSSDPDDFYAPSGALTVSFNYCSFDEDGLGLGVTPGGDDNLDTDYASLQLVGNVSGGPGGFGGPTETYMPDLVGSPFPNPALSSPLVDFIPAEEYGVMTDQRGFIRPVQSFEDPDGLADIGAVEASGLLPELDSVVVNDDLEHRSRLTNIDVYFNSPVPIAALTAYGAVRLTRTASPLDGLSNPSETVGVVVQSGAVGPFGRIVVTPVPEDEFVSIVLLTFENADGSDETDGVEFGSLADGAWQLEIPSIQYESEFNGTYIRRLFGDFDNSGTLDEWDEYQFEIADSLYDAAFDFNADSDVNGDDFVEFEAREDLTLNP